MKIFLIILSAVLVGCYSSNETKRTFAYCFSNIDSTKNGETVGCADNYYKLINNKYVVCISPKAPIKIGACDVLRFDTTSLQFNAKLLIFDNRDAHLSNICTDLDLVNLPRPSRIVDLKFGELQIGYSDVQELYGNYTYCTTIIVKTLEFLDSTTSEQIILKDQLLWKVLNQGNSG
jgi:hypothetical protein